MGMQGTGREGGAGVGGGWRQVGKGGRGENRRRRAGRGGRRGWGHAPRWAAPTLGCSAPTWPRLQAHPSPWPAGRRGLEELKKPDSESQRAPRHRPAPRFGGSCSPAPADTRIRSERWDSVSQRTPHQVTSFRTALAVDAAGLSPAVAATAAASRARGPGCPRARGGCGWEPSRALRSGPGEAGMEPPGGGRAAGWARAWGG